VFFACRVAAIVIAFAAVMLPAGSAFAQTRVRFALEWKLDATAAPLLVAIDKGYFKAEGLNVSIVEPVLPEPGEGANATARRIAADDAEMGFGDLNALLRARDAEPPAPVKAVFVVYNKPGYAVIARKSRGIEYPTDLIGKKVGTPPRDPASALWKVFMSANALPADRVMTENIGLPVRDPMVASGQIDAVTAMSYYSYIDLKDRGVPANDINVMLMGDYGVKLYGSSIMASEKFARENPEAVRGFLRAFARGLKDTIVKPAQAIEPVLKRDSGLHKDLELERLKMTIQENIVTPETKANGYGGIVPERLNAAIDQIDAAAAFNKKPRAEDVFDASFLPQRKD
jgi:NitT/TauT family transport system substrate-binding protein